LSNTNLKKYPVIPNTDSFKPMTNQKPPEGGF